MTQHPLTTLPPEALPGWAAAMRWTRDALLASAPMIATSAMLPRIEDMLAIAEGLARQPAPPVTSDRTAGLFAQCATEFGARFEAVAHRTAPHPATAMQICAAADAQCVARCTIQQDGQCGRDTPPEAPFPPLDFTRPPMAQRWYRLPGQEDRCKSVAELLSDMPALEPYLIESSEWSGTRAAFLVPNDEGPHDAILVETLAEAQAYLADLPLTPAEAAQDTLAEAVAESLATKPPSDIWTEKRDALLALLYPTIICQDAVHALINALPGTPIASVQAVRQRAAGRGIRRTGAPLPEGYEDQPLARRSPQGLPGALKAATPPDAPPRASLRADNPWTQERLALLTRCFPTIMPIGAIRTEMNRLPGLEIASDNLVRSKAEKLGLHRRGDPVPEEFGAAGFAASGLARNGAKPGTWTTERLALLRRDYPGTRPLPDILADVNALPGPPVPSVEAVTAKAKILDLTRRQGPVAGPAIAPSAAETRSQAYIPLSTEERHEALEMLRTGKLKGAVDVQEEYGCSHEEALAIVDQHRNRKARAG